MYTPDCLAKSTRPALVGPFGLFQAVAEDPVGDLRIVEGLAGFGEHLGNGLQPSHPELLVKCVLNGEHCTPLGL